MKNNWSAFHFWQRICTQESTLHHAGWSALCSEAWLGGNGANESGKVNTALKCGVFPLLTDSTDLPHFSITQLLDLR